MMSERSSRERVTGSDARRFIVVGGGPGGLTSAYELTKLGFHPTVLEKLDDVGGLARPAHFKGFRFDLGGHRFYTAVAEVDKLRHEVIEDCFRRGRRLYHHC